MRQKFQCDEFDYKATEKIVTHQKNVHIGQKLECSEFDYQSQYEGDVAKHHKSIHIGNINQHEQLKTIRSPCQTNKSLTL